MQRLARGSYTTEEVVNGRAAGCGTRADAPTKVTRQRTAMMTALFRRKAKIGQRLSPLLRKPPHQSNAQYPGDQGRDLLVPAAIA